MRKSKKRSEKIHQPEDLLTNSGESDVVRYTLITHHTTIKVTAPIEEGNNLKEINCVRVESRRGGKKEEF